MNYQVNVKPKLSVLAIVAGVLFALAALSMIVISVAQGAFSSMLFVYKVLYGVCVLAFAGVAVTILAGANHAIIAIPFGVLALREVVYFVMFVISFPFVDYFSWFGFGRGMAYVAPTLLTYLLIIVSFLLAMVACFIRKSKKAVCIASGAVYAVATVINWIIYPLLNNAAYGYSLNFGFIIRIITGNFVGYLPDIITSVALILLGMALAKSAPAMRGYAQYQPMQNGYAPNYVPNAYAPNGYMQNGYAPMQNNNCAPVQQTPMQSSAPTQVQSAPAPCCESKADSSADQISEQLSAYKKMLDEGLISEADFEAKKKQILGL